MYKGLVLLLAYISPLKSVLLGKTNLSPSSVEKRSGQAVAIKVIDIESAEDEVEDIIQEIAILSELQSPYVTKYYGSYAKGAELWIVMEYLGGGSCLDLVSLPFEDCLCNLRTNGTFSLQIAEARAFRLQ